MAEQETETSELQQEKEEARAKLEELEGRDAEDIPTDPKEWPDGRAKYETFGGGEGNHGYDEGPEAKLGPSGVRHHEDGKVTIDGDEVDDPDTYKGEPIPGGPTDPNAPELAGED